MNFICRWKFSWKIDLHFFAELLDATCWGDATGLGPARQAVLRVILKLRLWINQREYRQSVECCLIALFFSLQMNANAVAEYQISYDSQAIFFVVHVNLPAFHLFSSNFLVKYFQLEKCEHSQTQLVLKS